MANGKTKTMQKQAVKELQKEAKKLQSEFEDYLDDLRLFSNPEFWEAVEEAQQGKGRMFSSIDELIKELDQ